MKKKNELEELLFSDISDSVSISLTQNDIAILNKILEYEKDINNKLNNLQINIDRIERELSNRRRYGGYLYEYRYSKR